MQASSVVEHSGSKRVSERNLSTDLACGLDSRKPVAVSNQRWLQDAREPERLDFKIKKRTAQMPRNTCPRLLRYPAGDGLDLFLHFVIGGILPARYLQMTRPAAERRHRLFAANDPDGSDSKPW